MDPKTSLIKLIESYVDSSTTPSQQVASVNSIATLLKNDTITMEHLVREMELYLTTTEHVLRARGMLLLAEVLGHLQQKPLNSTTVHTLVGFFSERLADWRALHGALVGCLALVRRKTGVITGVDAKTLAQSFLENLQVQSLGQHDRKLCFELLECLIDRYRESISSLGEHVVYGVCEAIEGEKDPQCLMKVFHIVELLAKTFPDPSGPVANFAEDLFDIVGRYFPIHYTHEKSEDDNISREDLSRALMMAFSASPFFEPFSIPLLLEKLSSNLPLAKIDSLKYLSYCVVKYGPERTAKHVNSIWSFLKTSIFNISIEDFSTSDSDLSNGMDFQENEITKEALNLLHTMASPQSSGFLNLVFEDKDIKALITMFITSKSSGFVSSQNEQKVYIFGRILSVSVKSSTYSCNKVFDTLFLQLLDSLGVSESTSNNVLVKDSTYQRLNSRVLYLCIEILGACKELAVSSVRTTSNCDFVNDVWCQMLAENSSSLVKALVMDLVPSNNKMNDDADLSLRVKGLQILATFPGESTPMSNSVFELILDTLVSNVTNNFEVTVLWELSLNALADIGTFLNEYSNSKKYASYMSTVVEKLTSLILLEDSRMPYSLLLDALSKISTGGHKFVSRIVEGVQEAISVKMAKVHADGDVKVCAELVQLLDCYSMKLLPWFQTFKGSDSVPLRLAIDIWDKIDAATASSFITEGKLLHATKTALKLAVALLSEEDQQQIIKKACAAFSSNLSFSPNSVPSKVEELQILGNIDGLTCRDAWISSLFASVIIALRPKTPIGDTKAIVESLLKACLKGDVTSAQALGSIVNKMPLTNNDMQDSSHFDLDDVLALILEGSLGSDSWPLQVHSVTGLAWIGKGLLMRGHEKLKDITMVLLRCLVSGKELEAITEKNGWSEKELLLLARLAVDAFSVLMSDSKDCLNKTFHATVRPLYKQRFFSTVLPVLLSEAKRAQSHTVRSLLYQAIGHIISNTPLAAVLTETKKILSVLLDVITLLSEDVCNKDMIYNLLLVFSGLLMDKNGHDVAVENAHVIVNCLTGLLSYPHKMLVRETAVQCLVAVSGMPHTRIYPLRMQVLKALSKVLDDPKRSVRQEAVRCRQAWSSMA